MALYEYKCPRCDIRYSTSHRASKIPNYPCGGCEQRVDLQRVWSVSFAPVMQEHFNRTLGKPVSDMKRFRDELRAAGNKATDQTGIPHRYEPVDMSDHEGLGVTGEGLYESNVERSKRGEPLLPMPPGS